jgi:hypothetical protein
LKYEEEIELPFIKFFKEKFSSLKEESGKKLFFLAFINRYDSRFS